MNSLQNLYADDRCIALGLDRPFKFVAAKARTVTDNKVAQFVIKLIPLIITGPLLALAMLIKAPQYAYNVHCENRQKGLDKKLLMLLNSKSCTIESLRQLIKSGAQFLVKPKEVTLAHPMYAAVQNGNWAAVEVMVKDLHVDINFCESMDRLENTILHIKSMPSLPVQVRGSEQSSPNEANPLLLYLSKELSSLKRPTAATAQRVQWLIEEMGADVNVKALYSNETPLMMIARMSTDDGWGDLFNCVNSRSTDATRSAQNSVGWNVNFHLMCAGNLEGIRTMHQVHGVPFGEERGDSPPYARHNLLSAAAYGGKAEIARYLIEQRMDPREKRHSKTALHHAVSRGDLDTVMAIVEAGGNDLVNIPISTGQLPMHMANTASRDYAPTRYGAIIDYLKSVPGAQIVGDPSEAID